MADCEIHDAPSHNRPPEISRGLGRNQGEFGLRVNNEIKQTSQITC